MNGQKASSMWRRAGYVILKLLRVFSLSPKFSFYFWLGSLVLTAILLRGPHQTQLTMMSVREAEYQQGKSYIPDAWRHDSLDDGIKEYAYALHKPLEDRLDRWFDPSQYDLEARVFSYDERSAESFLPPFIKPQPNTMHSIEDLAKLPPKSISAFPYNLPQTIIPGAQVPKVLPPSAEHVVRIMESLAETETGRVWMSPTESANSLSPSEARTRLNRFPLSQSAIDNALAAEDNCVIVQIFRGEIYVTSPNEARYDGHSYHEERRMETIRYIKHLLSLQHHNGATVSPESSPMGPVTQTKFPWSRTLRDDLRARMSFDRTLSLTNNEFALCVPDYPASQNPLEAVQLTPGAPERPQSSFAAAAFTHIGCGRRSGSVGVPMWNVKRLQGFRGWAGIIDKMTEMTVNSSNWNERHGRALFRGETRFCYGTRDDFTIPMTYIPHANTTLSQISGSEGVLSGASASISAASNSGVSSSAATTSSARSAFQSESSSSLEWKHPGSEYSTATPRYPPEIHQLSPKNVAAGAQPLRHGGPPTYVVPLEEYWKKCGRGRLGHLSTLNSTAANSETAQFLDRYVTHRVNTSTLHASYAKRKLVESHSQSRVIPLTELLDVALGDMQPYMRDAGIAPLELNFLPMHKWNSHKFMLTAEGNCGWGDRIKNQVFMDVALVLQESMCKEWYTPLLQPWVHYIPTDYHFNNLHGALLWANAPENQDDVRQMIANMNTWGHAMLSPEAIELYMRQVLNAHARRLAFRVQLRPGAEKYDDYFARINGLAWKINLGRHEASVFLRGHVILWLVFAPLLLTFFASVVRKMIVSRRNMRHEYIHVHLTTDPRSAYLAKPGDDISHT